jgi:hypothetical protein
MLWGRVYNILKHEKEADRILYEDPDPKTGFLILPDLKWDRKTISTLVRSSPPSPSLLSDPIIGNAVPIRNRLRPTDQIPPGPNKTPSSPPLQHQGLFRGSRQAGIRTGGE